MPSVAGSRVASSGVDCQFRRGRRRGIHRVVHERRRRENVQQVLSPARHTLPVAGSAKAEQIQEGDEETETVLLVRQLQVQRHVLSARPLFVSIVIHGVHLFGLLIIAKAEYSTLPPVSRMIEISRL